MNREIISDKQKIFMLSFYLIGETSTYIIGSAAKQDFWVAIILSIFIAVIMALILGRLHHLFPQKNLFDIIEIIFGKLIGKIIMLLFIWYTFEYTSQMLIYLAGYINTVSFPETPRIVPAICAVILCIWIAKAGISLIGKYTELLFPFITVVIFVTAALLIPQMNVENLYPILYNGMKPILKGTFIAFVYPFGEIVIFSLIFSHFETRKSSYKIFILPLLISGVLTIITSLTSTLVLGANMGLITYFPSYTTISRMNIGDFLQRMEVISATVFILGGTIKAGILLLVTSEGISKVFGFKDYRFIVTAIALLAINLFYFEFDSGIDAYQFYFNIYSYIVVLFQIILPIIIWVTAEIDNRRVKIPLH